MTMNNPPQVNPVTLYLFDNPIPALAVCIVLAVFCGVLTVKLQKKAYSSAALLFTVLAAAVFITERVVVTSGEKSQGVIEKLVDAAGNGSVNLALSHFSDDCIISLVSPKNPGVGFETIERSLDRLVSQYYVQWAEIMKMNVYSVASDQAIVSIRVKAEIRYEPAIPLPVSSSWIFRVEKQEDGAWLVMHATFVDYDGQSPTMDVFR